MRVSVAICTRNRAESLSRVLASAQQMTVTGGLEWELLVIDNGSTDRTTDVAAEFASVLPVRRVLEPRPGLANARNRAVAEAAGDYICFTDDDVTLEPSWLCAYAEAFDLHPQAVVFGGKITPVLEPPTPAWLENNYDLLSGIVGHRDLGPEMARLSVEGNRLPYGANYAIRMREQRAFPYDPELGISPVQHRSGEESQVIRAILNTGAEGVWVPKAALLHHVTKAQQTQRHVFRYQRGVGETWAYLDWKGEENFFGPVPAGPRVLNVPLPVWKSLVLSWLKYRLTAAHPDRWLWHWMTYGFARGAAEFWLRHGAYAARNRSSESLAAQPGGA